MTAHITRRLASTAITAMLALSVAACGGGSDASPSTKPASDTSIDAPQDTSVASQDTSVASQDTSVASQDTSVAADPTTDPQGDREVTEFVGGPGIDIDAKTITVAALSPLTGPAEIIGVPATAGQRAYFQALNAAGGIDGWTIELLESDSQYNPQIHKQLYDEVSGDIALLSQSVGSPTTAAIVDDVVADGMTVLPASLALPLCRIPNMVLFGTPYRLDVMNGFQWLVDERDAAEGAPVAIVYQDDEYGQDGLAGFQAATDSLGFDNVGEFTFGRTDTDFTPLVQTLQSSGAEYVQLTATPSQTGPILAQAAQSGYNPTWLLSGPSWDEALLTRAGIPAEVFSDAYVVTSIAPWGEPGIAGMDEMIANSARFTPDQAPSIFYVVGYAQGRIVESIFATAIANGDLSRAGIAAAAAQQPGIAMDGFMPDLSLSSEDRIPSRESSVFAIDPDAPSSMRRVAALFSGPLAKEASCE